MKFNLKKPCKDCPFRNDKPHQRGWLGEARATEIYEDLIDGRLFPCHKTHDYSQDSHDEQGNFVHQDNHQFCAGALIMLENKQATAQSQALRMAVALGIYEPSQLDKDAPVFKSGDEFIEFHNDEN